MDAQSDATLADDEAKPVKPRRRYHVALTASEILERLITADSIAPFLTNECYPLI